MADPLNPAVKCTAAYCKQNGAMVVYGGYNGKETFGDTWVLKTCDWSWQQLHTSGEPI